MKSSAWLRNLLHQIDHRGYPAYKDTRGLYDFGDWQLSIDHVQGDPFAAPSKVSVIVPGGQAHFDPGFTRTDSRRVAMEDFLLRQFGRELQAVSFKARGSGKSGLMTVSRPGQEILERTACAVDPETGEIRLRMEIGFPANGRTVNSRELERILFEFLPDCVHRSLYAKTADLRCLRKAAELADDQDAIREEVRKRNLVAFVADGAILPRQSGISGKPMQDAVPFCSPESLRVTLNLPHRGSLTGMGIPRGITLIVGGGYHGKSTLLKALELGVYNHIAGDGREYVITDETAVKLRAEDGRSIRHVDISMFICNLPNGKDTTAFYTEDASGSTSQAANLVESMEAGCHTLLIDEDTSATNFMIRDELMQQVVHRDDEPIIPLIDRVRELYREYGISTVLVAGSSGAYFQPADCIIQMKQYRPQEITARAKEAAAAYPSLSQELPVHRPPDYTRPVRPDLSLRRDNRIKIKTMGRDSFLLNKETVDLRYVEQLVDSEQVTALACLLKYAELSVFDGHRTLGEALEFVWRMVEQKGLGAVCGEGSGLALPRKQELYACVNRYRRLEMTQQ